MFEEAAGLAVVAAISPPAMLIVMLYLGSRRPGQNALWFLLGGILIVTVIGVAALIAIRAGGLSLPSGHQTRYGLRLGLGLLAMAAAVVLALRKPGTGTRAERRGSEDQAGSQAAEGQAAEGQAAEGQPAERSGKRRSPVQRLTAEPKPLTAFIVGIFMFGPSVTFLAAVQVVGTDKASVAATAGAMAMIIVLVVSFAWLPLAAYLIAPDATVRRLRALEEALRRHRRMIMVSAIGLIGVLLTIQGIAGLA